MGYGKIQSLGITADTQKEYTFHTIPGVPQIIVAPAADGNPEFLAYRARLQAQESVRLAKAKAEKDSGAQRTVEAIEADILEQHAESLAADKKLVAQVCVRGWGGRPPRTDDGVVQPFSKEEAAAFIEALPGEIFRPLSAFVQNIYNFIEIFEPDDDGVALGNS